jgi:glycosyl transferase, family 25
LEGIVAEIRVYVINLDRATERLAAMGALLGRLGMPFQRISAFDAKNLTIEQARKMTSPRLGAIIRDLPFYLGCEESEPSIYFPELRRYLCAGEIACYLSHVCTIETFMQSGAEAAVIFEDDVDIDSDLPGLLSAVNGLEHGAMIVKLEGLARAHQMNFPIARLDGREIAMMLKPTTGAAGYYLNRAAAAKLLQNAFPIREPYDAFLRQYWLHGVEVLEVLEFPVRQLPVGSSIVGRERQHRAPVPPLRASLLAAARPLLKAERLVRRLTYLARRPLRLASLRLRSAALARPARH